MCRKATISERSELLTPSGVGSSHGTETPVLLVGGTSPAGETDVCSISTKSIESIQIVHDILSFEYNDIPLQMLAYVILRSWNVMTQFYKKTSSINKVKDALPTLRLGRSASQANKRFQPFRTEKQVQFFLEQKFFQM